MSDYLNLVYHYSKWKIQEFINETEIFRKLPLMESSLTGSALIIAYIYFAKIGGPSFMRYRTPFYLREPLICYNFMMSVLNLALFLGFGRHELSDKFNLFNKSVYGANQINQLSYIFYLSKFVQFSDTVFMILLEKESDISSFHILQRTLTPFLHWFSMKHAPGLQTNMFSLIISLLHTLTYSYYGMKMMNPKGQKSSKYQLAMKKIRTIHFYTVIAHGVLLYLRNTRAMHKYLSINFIPAFLMLGLFIHAYIGMYRKRVQRKKSVIIYDEDSSENDPKRNGATKKRSTNEQHSTISYTNLTNLELQKKLAIF